MATTVSIHGSEAPVAPHVTNLPDSARPFEQGTIPLMISGHLAKACRTGLVGLLVAVLAPAVAFAQERSLDLPYLYEPPLPSPGDAATREFGNGVRMYGDLTYSDVVGYRPLKLDLYLPENAASGAPLPVVVWFHGGGYRIGNPRSDWTYGDWSAVLARLSARGYAVAGVTYRFKQEASYPAQLEDAHAALAFLRMHAGRWNLDKQRVYSWGLSAGAHLALMVGVMSPNADPQHQVAGAVDWFGPTDFAANRSERSLQSHSVLLGCPATCTDERFTEASPATYVSAKTPPTLIVHGVEDNLVPIEQADILYDRMKRAGARVTYDRMEGMSHGFEGGSSVQLEQILMRTFDFFDSLADEGDGNIER